MISFIRTSCKGHISTPLAGSRKYCTRHYRSWNMAIVGMSYWLFFLVIYAPCLTNACDYQKTLTYGSYNCAGKEDGAKCCYKNDQGYCNTTASGTKVCINGAIGTCMFHTCSKRNGGGCKTVKKTGKTGCLDRRQVACGDKNLNDVCLYEGGGVWEGRCGNTSTPVSESEVLGCGSQKTCYSCLHGSHGACWDKPEGGTCRSYRTYNSGGYGNGRAGWTTYTGGTCTTYFPYCQGAKGTFTPDNPSSETSEENSIFYFILISISIVASATSMVGFRYIMQVRKFIDRLKKASFK